MCILDIFKVKGASVMVDIGEGGGGGGLNSRLMLLLRVSGSEAHSQNTHGEQAE